MEQAQVGTAPGVGMAEETGGLTEQQGGELDSKAGQVEEEGRADSEQPLGEDQIYPDVPPETLTADVPEGGQEKGAASKSGGGPQIQGVPPEAVSEVAEHEEGPKIQSAFKKGQDDLATEREKKDTDFQASQRKHEEDVRAEVDANTRSQADERERAKSEVVADRENWRAEQDAELADIDTKKGEKSKAVREDIDKEEQDTDDKVEQREKDDDEAITKKSTEATEEAETERDDAKEDSGNWVTKAFDAIKQWLEDLKNTIVGIFERARQAVVDLITNFQETVTGWIEEVRNSIVEMFEEFVEAIVELGRELLEAIQEIADRIRDFIIDLIADAIAFINDLANELKEMLDELLDQIGQILTDILDALKRGLEAALDAVKGVLKGAMDLAMGLLNALGEWMTIAGDIISDPGGWLSGAAASAEDGARNHLVPEAQSAIKQWFNDKVQEILGIDKETFDLLISGGMTVEEIVEEAWAAILPQLPMIIGELVITKVVAKLIPGAGWVMAIIDALKAAYETLSEILRAFGLVIDYLKAVKSGNAGRPFAKAVAAGIVALIELVFNALVSGIGKYVGKVTERLKGVAKGFKDKSPSNPDSDDRKDQGDEVNAAQQQTNNANENLNSQPQNNPPANNSNNTNNQSTSTTNRTDDDKKQDTDNRKDSTSDNSKDKDKDSDTNRRDDDTRNKDKDGGKDRKKEEGKDKDKPRRKPSPAGRSHKRSKKTTKAALKRNRRAKKALGRKGKNSKTGRKLDNDARKMRRAYKNRRDQLRRQQQRRHEERRGQRDERRKKENSPESKAARLRKIVARLEPRTDALLKRGVKGVILRGFLSAARLRYRLTDLSIRGDDSFSLHARLNPQIDFSNGASVDRDRLLRFLRQVAREVVYSNTSRRDAATGISQQVLPRGKKPKDRTVLKVEEGVGMGAVQNYSRRMAPSRPGVWEDVDLERNGNQPPITISRKQGYWPSNPNIVPLEQQGRHRVIRNKVASVPIPKSSSQPQQGGGQVPSTAKESYKKLIRDASQPNVGPGLSRNSLDIMKGERPVNSLAKASAGLTDVVSDIEGMRSIAATTTSALMMESAVASGGPPDLASFQMIAQGAQKDAEELNKFVEFDSRRGGSAEGLGRGAQNMMKAELDIVENWIKGLDIKVDRSSKKSTEDQLFDQIRKHVHAAYGTEKNDVAAFQMWNDAKRQGVSFQDFQRVLQARKGANGF
ncbi:phage tail protein [Streptomyces regalis]|uniref:phage tail protein n=1 Tax=Streptomyces regalis TaxID=68262 RepID=UPI00131BAD23|nr:hypothetical protein [Streptomyces regalis]